MHVFNKNNKPEAYINQWGMFANSLMGSISKHYRQDEFRGDIQRTSNVVEINEEEGWAETANTFYILGERAW